MKSSKLQSETQNWQIRKLGELISFEKGKKMKVLEEKIGGAEPYIGIDNLRTNTYSFHTQENYGIRCEPEDVLLVWDGAYAGTVGIGLRGFVGSTIVKVLHDSSLNSRFWPIFFILTRQEFALPPKGLLFLI